MSRPGNQMAKQRARQFVDGYLAQRSCVDCGESGIEILTFDHVRGDKKMNIADLVSDGYSTKRIADEIEKTEVVCQLSHET